MAEPEPVLQKLPFVIVTLSEHDEPTYARRNEIWQEMNQAMKTTFYRAKYHEDTHTLELNIDASRARFFIRLMGRHSVERQMFAKRMSRAATEIDVASIAVHKPVDPDGSGNFRSYVVKIFPRPAAAPAI